MTIPARIVEAIIAARAERDAKAEDARLEAAEVAERRARVADALRTARDLDQHTASGDQQ